MIRLNAIKSEKVWGYELWIASTHKNGTQKDFLEYCGGEYPLLVKVIQADQSLSVQVHPDDQTAVRLEGDGAVGNGYRRTGRRGEFVCGGDAFVADAASE